jgi:hypothetical protein
MRRYQFWRLHIASGERTIGELDAHSTAHFLECLNSYNRQMPGLWQYWAEASQLQGKIV